MQWAIFVKTVMSLSICPKGCHSPRQKMKQSSQNRVDKDIQQMRQQKPSKNILEKNLFNSFIDHVIKSMLFGFYLMPRYLDTLIDDLLETIVEE